MHRCSPLIAVVLSVTALMLTSIAGCSNSPSGGGASNGRGMMGGGAPRSGAAGGSGAGTSGTNSSSEGQRIYLTGVATNGQDVPRSAPRVSQGALMMGGGGCGSCHAANGRGGTIRMMTGTAIKAPDIRYSALIKAGFIDATIRRAIRDGLDESGKPLKIAMPRWQMSDGDLNATIAYLKQLSTQ